jgi:hypothetical protein
VLRLDEPVPGTASLFTMPMGGQVMLFADFYLYGDQAAATIAARAEPAWKAWMNEKFPAAAPDAGSVS